MESFMDSLTCSGGGAITVLDAVSSSLEYLASSHSLVSWDWAIQLSDIGSAKHGHTIKLTILTIKNTLMPSPNSFGSLSFRNAKRVPVKVGTLD